MGTHPSNVLQNSFLKRMPQPHAVWFLHLLITCADDMSCTFAVGNITCQAVLLIFHLIATLSLLMATMRYAECH